MSNPSSPLCIQSVFAGQINKNSLSIPLKIRLKNKTIKTLSLLDSRAGGKIIDQNYAKNLNLPLLNLKKPIPAINVNGTLNKKGTIKQYINLDLEIFGRKQIIWQKMLLGFPWLQRYNPIIDWQTSSFHWQHIPQRFNFRKRSKSLLMRSTSPKPSISEEEEPEEWMTQTVNILGTDYCNALISPLMEIEEQIMDKGTWINLKTNSEWICSKTNFATNLAITENQKKEDLTDKQIVPPEYHEFLDIFNEKRASQFPDKWP